MKFAPGSYAEGCSEEWTRLFSAQADVQSFRVGHRLVSNTVHHLEEEARQALLNSRTQGARRKRETAKTPLKSQKNRENAAFFQGYVTVKWWPILIL